MVEINFERAKLPEGAVKFIATFLRFEFALKEDGFSPNAGDALVEWGRRNSWDPGSRSRGLGWRKWELPNAFAHCSAQIIGNWPRQARLQYRVKCSSFHFSGAC